MSNYGECRNGRWAKGCGQQPAIVNCADIAILPDVLPADVLTLKHSGTHEHGNDERWGKHLHDKSNGMTGQAGTRLSDNSKERSMEVSTRINKNMRKSVSYSTTATNASVTSSRVDILTTTNLSITDPPSVLIANERSDKHDIQTTISSISVDNITKIYSYIDNDRNNSEQSDITEIGLPKETPLVDATTQTLFVTTRSTTAKTDEHRDSLQLNETSSTQPDSSKQSANVADTLPVTDNATTITGESMINQTSKGYIENINETTTVGNANHTSTDSTADGTPVGDKIVDVTEKYGETTPDSFFYWVTTESYGIENDSVRTDITSGQEATTPMFPIVSTDMPSTRSSSLPMTVLNEAKTENISTTPMRHTSTTQIYQSYPDNPREVISNMVTTPHTTEFVMDNSSVLGNTTSAATYRLLSNETVSYLVNSSSQNVTESDALNKMATESIYMYNKNLPATPETGNYTLHTQTINETYDHTHSFATTIVSTVSKKSSVLLSSTENIPDLVNASQEGNISDADPKLTTMLPTKPSDISNITSVSRLETLENISMSEEGLHNSTGWDGSWAENDTPNGQWISLLNTTFLDKNDAENGNYTNAFETSTTYMLNNTESVKLEGTTQQMGNMPNIVDGGSKIPQNDGNNPESENVTVVPESSTLLPDTPTFQPPRASQTDAGVLESPKEKDVVLDLGLLERRTVTLTDDKRQEVALLLRTLERLGLLNEDTDITQQREPNTLSKKQLQMKGQYKQQQNRVKNQGNQDDLLGIKVTTKNTKELTMDFPRMKSKAANNKSNIETDSDKYKYVATNTNETLKTGLTSLPVQEGYKTETTAPVDVQVRRFQTSMNNETTTTMKGLTTGVPTTDKQARSVTESTIGSKQQQRTVHKEEPASSQAPGLRVATLFPIDPSLGIQLIGNTGRIRYEQSP